MLAIRKPESKKTNLPNGKSRFQVFQIFPGTLVLCLGGKFRGNARLAAAIAPQILTPRWAGLAEPPAGRYGDSTGQPKKRRTQGLPGGQGRENPALSQARERLSAQLNF